MGLNLTSNRLPIAPTVNVNDVYCYIPKDSVAYLPSDSSWQFQMRYFLSADVRNTQKVLDYFRTLSVKPDDWTATRWAFIQNLRSLNATPVFAIETHTTENLGIDNPADINGALTQIYGWVKANCEPTARDLMDDSSIDDLANAYFISQGV